MRIMKHILIAMFALLPGILSGQDIVVGIEKLLFFERLHYFQEGIVYWIANPLIIDYIKIDNETFMYFCKEGMGY